MTSSEPKRIWTGLESESLSPSPSQPFSPPEDSALPPKQRLGCSISTPAIPPSSTATSSRIIFWCRPPPSVREQKNDECGRCVRTIQSRSATSGWRDSGPQSHMSQRPMQGLAHLLGLLFLSARSSPPTVTGWLPKCCEGNRSTRAVTCMALVSFSGKCSQG